MKTKNLIFIVFVLFFSFNGKTQIVVDCDNERVGIGYGMSSPSFKVDILGGTRIRPSSGGDYIAISSITPYGWVLNPNTQYKGIIGYYSSLYSVSAQYIYGSNIVYSSDENLKRNIHTLYGALPIIKKLRPVSFDYHTDYSSVEDTNVRTKLESDDKNRLDLSHKKCSKSYRNQF